MTDALRMLTELMEGLEEMTSKNDGIFKELAEKSISELDEMIAALLYFFSMKNKMAMYESMAQDIEDKAARN